MKFENTETWGFEHAIRGMTADTNSDSVFHYAITKVNEVTPYSDAVPAEVVDCVSIGENDLKLAQTLIKAGYEHREFMQQIFASVAITAPLYWWNELYDTCKVGMVANGTNAMHNLTDAPITIDCFEMDDFDNSIIMPLRELNLEHNWNADIALFEFLRQKYNAIMKNKKELEEIKEFEEAEKAQVMATKYWNELIRLLPGSWLQKRTVTMSYENVLEMVRKNKNNKFIEWAHTLPYADEILFI